MNEHEQPETDLDPALAADGAAGSRPKAVGAPFRLATLLVGLAAFAGLVWLLFRL